MANAAKISSRSRTREKKTQQVRWFGVDQLPGNLTMAATNAIAAYLPALRSYFANQLTSRVLLSISCANRIPGDFTSPVN
jgi:hypothetical protein